MQKHEPTETSQILSAILQHTHVLAAFLDRNFDFVWVNSAYAEASGHDRSFFPGKNHFEVYPGEEDRAIFQRVVETGEPFFVSARPFEYADQPERGLTYWDWSLIPIKDARGQVNGHVLTLLEVTGRIRAEERIRALAEMVDYAPNSITIHDEQGRFLYANRKSFALHRYTPEEFLAINLHDLDIPESEALIEQRIRWIREQGEATFEVGHRRKDGSILPLEVTVKTIDWLGRPAFLSIGRDTTERNRAEQERERSLAALKESERRHREYITNTPYGVFVTDERGRYQQVNPAACQMTGYSEAELLTMSIPDVQAEPDQDMGRQHFLTLLREGKAQGELAFRTRSGERRWWSVLAVKLSETRFIGFCNDVTDRKLAEQELRERERMLAQIFEILPVGLWIADRDGRLLRGNPVGVRIWGAEPHVGIEQYGIFKARRYPSGEEIRAEDWALAHTVREGVTITDELLEIDAFDGKRRLILNSTAPVKDEHGVVQAAVIVNQDVTEQKMLELQMQQAMKMEAIGRLAGGVAHDFNNLLTGITGNVELALLDLRPGDPLEELLREIAQAANSAAALTRQLLAFSRKQLIAPRVLDLNEQVGSLHRMLARLIGEDIELELALARPLAAVEVDPGQLEQILVNLAVNARDAMPDGGRLTLRTADVVLDEEYCRQHAHPHPGSHVMLEVSDTGLGMSEEVKSHLFEPFFTTKPKGRGTGLGLATIYGAVKQAGGHIEVRSAPGQGTSFRIFFPRVARTAVQSPSRPARFGQMPGGNETVLLVEDEAMVRELAARILERLGYRVLQAPDGPQALRLAEQHTAPIDLLLTDVVMPGMNGRQLARRLSEVHPETKVMYSSGYSEDAIAHHGIIDEGLQYIAKPYTPEMLARKLREVLED